MARGNQTGPDMTTPAPETKIVNEYRVACDGGGASGHLQGAGQITSNAKLLVILTECLRLMGLF